MGEIDKKTDFSYVSEIEKTRIKITNILINFLKSHNKYLHLNYYPSAGKTHIAIRVLRDLGLFYIYLSPYHNLAEEQLKKFVFLKDVEHIEGRNRLCKHEEYKKLSKNNISISIMCKKCPYNPYNKDTKTYLGKTHPCEYYRRIKSIYEYPDTWFGVHHHLGGLVQDYIKKINGKKGKDKVKISGIVIDENPIENIKTEIKIDYSLLMKNVKFFSKLKKSKEKELLLYLMYNLKNIITTTTEEVESGRYLIYYKNLHDNILKTFPKINIENLKDLDLKFQEILVEQYFIKKKDCPKNVISSLIYFLIEMYNHISEMKDSFTFFKNSINIIQPKNPEKSHYVRLVFYNLNRLKIEGDVKVIFLDATTPPSFYEKLIGEKIVTSSKKVSLESSIYQLTSGRYPMTSIDWTRKIDGVQVIKNYLKEILRLICEKHKDTYVLVICRKKYEEELRKISKNIETAHYPISGSNKWEKGTVVVLFGCPEYSRNHIKTTADLLDVPIEEYRYLGRESKMIQGIHRIRPILSIRLKYIYILSKVDLDITFVRKLDKYSFIKLLEEEIEYGSIDDIQDEVRDKLITKILKDESKTFKEIKDLLEMKIGNEMLRILLDIFIDFDGSIRVFLKKGKNHYDLISELKPDKKTKLFEFIKSNPELTSIQIRDKFYDNKISLGTVKRRLNKLLESKKIERIKDKFGGSYIYKKVSD